MTSLFLAEQWCRIRDSVSALNCQLASLASQSGQKRTCCVVFKATEQEKRDAAACGVELILPCLSEEVVVAFGNDKPEPNWLLSPENYFTTLIDLKDIEHIVEHIQASTEFLFAHVLRKRYFKDAKVIIVNHTVPPGNDELKDTHLKFAESATAVFSIGPTVFDEYENLYERTGIEVKHELYLPRPENAFFDLNLDKITKTMNLKQILTVITDKDVESKRYELVSTAVDITAEIFHSIDNKNVKWSVRTKSVDDIHDARTSLKNKLKCSCVKLITSPPYGSHDNIYSDLRQSDVLVIPPDEPFSVEALQAIAAGLPVLVPRRTATAELLEKFFPGSAEYFLYDPTVDDLSRQINGMLKKSATTSMATKLKDDYFNNQSVSKTHENFRSCILGAVALKTKPGTFIRKWNSEQEVNESRRDKKEDTSHAKYVRMSLFVISLQCEVQLEIKEKKMRVEAQRVTSQLQVFELQKLRDQHEFEQEKKKMKMKQIDQVFQKQIEWLMKGHAPDTIDKMDKAYEKFQARLDKIDEGSLRCFLSFLSEENIDYFWQKFEAGDVDKILSDILVTPVMQSLADEAGCTVRIRSLVEKKEYELVKQILHNMTAVYTVPERTRVRTIAHDKWERYALQCVGENQARYLIEQSRYHPVVSELRNDDFFFPSFISYWIENSYTLPLTITEATEHAIKHHIDIHCREHKRKVENVWDVVQTGFCEIGNHIFDEILQAPTFSLTLDVPSSDTYLFGLFRDEKPSDTLSSLESQPCERRAFVSEHVHYYCLALYLSKMENMFQRKHIFEEFANSVPRVLGYLAGILKEKSLPLFQMLTTCLMKYNPANFEHLSTLGICLHESKCSESDTFLEIVEKMLETDSACDLSVLDFSKISLYDLEASAFILEKTHHQMNAIVVSEKEKPHLSGEFQDLLTGLIKTQESFVHAKIRNTVELIVIARFFKFYSCLLAQNREYDRRICQPVIKSIKIEPVDEGFNQIDSAVLQALVDALASLPFLKSLYIIGFNEIFVREVFGIMVANNIILKVKQLGLSHNGLGYTFTGELLESIQCLPFLRSLDLSNNKLGGLGCFTLVPLHGEVDVLLENNGIEDSLDTLSTSEQLAMHLRDLTAKLNTLEDIKTILENTKNIIDLDLSNTPTNIVSELCKIIAFFNNLKRLNLSKCNVSKDIAVILADSFCHLLSLSHLDLSSNNIGDDGVVYVGSKLHCLKKFSYANFHDTGISAKGIIGLLNTVPHNLHKHINVSHNIQHLAHILPYLGSKLSQYPYDLNLDAKELPLASLMFVKDLEVIDAVEIDSVLWTRNDFVSICKGLKNIDNVKTLALKNTNIGWVGIASLSKAIEKLTGIRKLDLRHNSIGDVGAEMLGKSMEKLTKLMQICLPYNNIGYVGCVSLSKGMKNLTKLRHLDLSHNNIEDVGVESLSNVIGEMTRMRHVDLSYNSIGSVGVEKLSEGIGNLSQCRHFDLSHNNIGDVGLQSLSKALEKMTRLRHIDLSQNNIGNFDGECLRKAVSQMKWLRYVDFSNNKIGNACMTTLSEGMKNLSRLRLLNLSNNSIGDVGMESLTKAMENMSHLRHLDLCNNNIGDFGAECLMKVVEKMTRLKHIDLSGNKIGNVGMEKVRRRIVNLSQFRSVDIRYINIGDVGVIGFSEGMVNINMM
ncbi:uncharacterized protein [Ptychodera flava]|uniref:uncharacterized protein n=1 Tax=Ptychodera flava TaxID=63121 RepID=UPI00396A85D4